MTIKEMLETINYLLKENLLSEEDFIALGIPGQERGQPYQVFDISRIGSFLECAFDPKSIKKNNATLLLIKNSDVAVK